MIANRLDIQTHEVHLGIILTFIRFFLDEVHLPEGSSSQPSHKLEVMYSFFAILVLNSPAGK